MSEATFTKKMEIGISNDNAPLCVDGFCNVDGERFEVCSVWGVDDDSIECGQSIANAHSIAAAPEMYKYLEMLSGQLAAINANHAVREIDALLAKARGEK